MNNILSYFLPSHFDLPNPSKEGLSALLLVLITNLKSPLGEM